MSTENRTPAGVPTGGQYAASAKGEAHAVTLLTPADQDLITEALGDGPDLTADEQRLLSILLDEDVNRDCGNDTDLDIVLEELEGNGHDDEFYGVERISDRLHAHYERETGRDGAGGFDFEVNTRGYDSASYSLGVYLGTRDGVWLRDTQDSKYLDAGRRVGGDASGLRKAIALAGVLDDDFQRLRTKAQTMGLLPAEAPAVDKPDLYAAKRALADYDATHESDDIDVDTMANMRDALASYVAADTAPKPAVWPQDSDERAAFEDYKTEVSNGDTAISFRDWYTNRGEFDEPHEA